MFGTYLKPCILMVTIQPSYTSYVSNSSHLRQRELLLIQYYSKMQTCWLELDQLESITFELTSDSVIYKKLIARRQTFELLAGLSQEFEPIRAQLLGQRPLPSHNKIYSALLRDDRRRIVMTPLGTERSAMVTTHSSMSPSTHGALASHGKDSSSDTCRDSKGPQKKGTNFCTYCKMTDHYVDSC